MSGIAINKPYPLFTDTDGTALEDGYIYVGAANLNPITSPIVVYWDSALTVPAAQPIRTINGYPSRNGTPANIFVGSNYSILLQNKNSVTIYSKLTSTELETFEGAIDIIGLDASDLDFTQVGTGAVTQSVQTKLEETVSVFDFMTDAQKADVKAGTLAFDVTAAIQAAIDSLPADGGTVIGLPGDYLVGTINFPDMPKVVNFDGSGAATMRLHMATAAGPVMRKAATGGRIIGARIGGFTVVANSGSDKTNLAHKGLDFTGWSNSLFEDIAYRSYAPGSGGLGVFMDFAANPYLTYQNTCRQINVSLSYGPSRGIRTHNNGAGVGSNPNVLKVEDSWFYALTGANILVDFGDCTRASLDNTLLESCAGATGVVLGQNTLVTGCWFEALGTNIATDSTRSTDGSASTVLSNYFSGAGTTFIDTINIKPLWIGNTGGGQTITGQGVAKIEVASSSPSAPTITGGDGTLTFVAATTVCPLDVTGRVTYRLYYTNTPASTGAKKFTIGAVSGYTLQSTSIGIVRGSTGVPTIVGIDTNGTDFWTQLLATDGHNITVMATFLRN